MSKMRSTIVMMIVLVAATFTFVKGGENEPNVVAVDVNRSEITWLGKKVTGEHHGKIVLKKGGFHFADAQLTGGIFVIDMNTITNEDLKDPGMNEKLVNHLKSDDFFGVAKHPEATLEVTDVEDHGDGKYHLTGNITIKGITETIEFPAKIEDMGSSYAAEADITIDRSKFDVRYGSGSFFDNLGDKMIYDDFNLKISLVANK
jgi:hypothetical protein